MLGGFPFSVREAVTKTLLFFVSCTSSEYILNELPVAFVKIWCYFLLLQRQNFIRITVVLRTHCCASCPTLSLVWQCCVVLGWAGLGTVHRGTDGLTCDLVGGPERYPSRDPGRWQAWPDVRGPGWDSDDDGNRTGHPGVSQTHRLPRFLSLTLSLTRFQPPQPAVSTLLLLLLLLLLLHTATITNRKTHSNTTQNRYLSRGSHHAGGRHNHPRHLHQLSDPTSQGYYKSSVWKIL